MYQFRHIILQMRQGASDRKIASAKLAGRQKSRQIRQIATKNGWLSNDNPLPDDSTLAQAMHIKPQDPKQLPLVSPYSEDIKLWVTQKIPATTIHNALIRKYNYCGSYDSVKRYVRTVKQEVLPQKSSCILNFSPAEAAQVDFGKGPIVTDTETGEIINSWFFVMTLCFSRHMYVEIVPDQSVITWLGCHRRAFEFFSGVPQKIIIDNPKCAITRACYKDPEVQRSYMACAESYGFMIAPCPPREPQMKGRVESGVKYVKGSFLPLREFRSLSDINNQVKSWILSEAGNRQHGSTHQKPLELFEQTERVLLTPLPSIAPEASAWSKVKVHVDCHVQYKKCRYSVPYRFIGKTLWLRASETTVRIYQEHDVIAQHTRQHSPSAPSTLNSHLPPNAQAYLMRSPTWCREQSSRIGSNCHRVVLKLFEDKVLDNLRTVQSILGLSKKYGAARLDAACKRALAFHSYRYITIKQILSSGADYEQLPDDQSLELLGNAYTHGRFIRSNSNTQH